ncbi:universal stress protein [Natribaculum luteum]|uniref:Universal stress protein n=1 Tax=Natribaculum luteum TaxID=1586232 RepID=A0ABD5P3Q9_9EURY|nr:universal stress protein [Natribaculum luteum]
MGDHILVPVDGSPLSRRALEVALEEYPDAEITALHVIDPTEPGYSVAGVEFQSDVEPRHGSEQWYERAEELATDLLDELTEIEDEHDASITTEVVTGRADREIVDYADSHDVDHIIMGSHGRGGDVHLLLGSVTEAVAFRAPMRVTLIR